ncbi:DUF805 domain-containing protein [Propylenella binzhouense]|uniref:DUF805 domain-containing protein n=1 Tax=Propylenella binzhouense TaxID=2555902 RepID=A0A964WUE2_9HYPH|nr:DUF805 domain-containing protein [Propylenella binzhouense]MYZ49027.1 DUF805 domain-containing protein [Propylenella binzhouense]
MLWAFFGLSGRIGRQVYWLVVLGLQAVLTVIFLQLIGREEASFFQIVSLLSPFVSIAILWSSIAVSVKRLHDIGMSGLWAVVALVPLINIAFHVWLGIVPPMRGPNRYGDRSDVPPA